MKKNGFSLMMVCIALVMLAFVNKTNAHKVVADSVTTEMVKPVALKFGVVSYDAVMKAMPEFEQAKQAMKELKEKYDNEATYNEKKFRDMYADYIAGQKSFPENIMLKRQKELQVAMEQGLNFRKDAQRQLTEAEEKMLAPIKEKLVTTLNMIGTEQGLAFILNIDNNACPFINPDLGVNVTGIAIERVLKVE